MTSTSFFKREKILFLIPSLECGGAERVVSLMANKWAQSKEVFIINFYNESVFYKLNDSITVINLNDKKIRIELNGIKKLINKIVRLKKHIITIKPDIIISFLPEANILGVLSARLTRVPIIITERNNPKLDIDDTKFKFLIPFWIVLRAVLYRLANIVVVQTCYAKEYYSRFYIKSVVIPNPVRTIKKGVNVKRDNFVLGIGRLVKQKQFDKLIFAFSRIDTTWKLFIIGDGPEKDNLIYLSKRLNVSDRIYFTGLITDVDDYLSRASIFALSSLYEGFPNALAEAMASGLACISFNCNSGPSDLILNGENGLLIENGNMNELTKGLKYLMDNETKRIDFGKKASRVAEILNEDVIIKKWEELILTLKK